MLHFDIQLHVSRFGQNIGLFLLINKDLVLQSYTQLLKMRKQIIFEQSSAQTCAVNVRNIFGFSINYVDDKIKKNGGKWNKKMRKFEVPISQMSQLAKELQSIDRSYYIQQVPSVIAEMVNKHSSVSNKVKKQILIDMNIVKRYCYIEQNVLKSIIQASKNQNMSKNYHKILIVCPDIKILTWMDNLQSFKTKRLTFQSKEPQACLNQDAVWICSYEILWSKSQQLSKYCFETIIIDQAEILASKITTQQEAALSFKKFLLSRHFIFPIISKLYLNRLQIIIPLLSIMLPQTNFSWFQRRYKKQNLAELYFVIKNCNLGRDINQNKDSKSGYSSEQKTYFNKILLSVSEQGIQKIKLLNKKYSQIQCKKLLQCPTLAKNKLEKAYMESMMQALREEKLECIFKHILYYCVQLRLKLAIIIQTSSVYRSIENYLCEHQITYCHYEHHQQVIDFNKNPTISVCLIKNQYLINVNFMQPLCTNDETLNTKLQNYEPEQYLCLSGVTNILFPDVDWVMNIKRKQQSLQQLFACAHRALVRHYFVLKGTYEQKWMKYLQQFIMKDQSNLRIREDLMEEEQGHVHDFDQTFAFCELNLAQVQEQYSHLKVIKGVTDIDDEFDRLEFQALQQKLQRQSKKKIKQQKVKQKQKEKLQDLIHQSNKKMIQQKDFSKKQRDAEDSEQEFQIFLMKLKQQQQTKQSYRQQNRQHKANIYQPISVSNSMPEQNRIYEAGNGQNKQSQLHKTCFKDGINIANQTKCPQQNTGKPGAQLNSSDQEIKDNICLQIIQQPKSTDHLNQDETDEVQIIQVRKPPKKPKLVKSKSPMLKVILRPSLG